MKVLLSVDTKYKLYSYYYYNLVCNKTRIFSLLFEEIPTYENLNLIMPNLEHCIALNEEYRKSFTQFVIPDANLFEPQLSI